MTTPVDLRELAYDRPSRTSGSVRPRRRHVMSRYVLPAAILSGFIGLMVWALRDTLWTATSVTVVPVVASRAEVQQADTPLFQAAGWVEPRPTPVTVSALVEGVIEKLTVIEGQEVEAGQPVAFLIDKDARLEMESAEVGVEHHQAGLDSARAALDAARVYLREPIQLQASLAEAEGQLAKVQTELNRLPALRRGAEARHALAEQEVASKTKSQDAVPAITVLRAKSEVESAAALIDEYKAQLSSLSRERDVLARRRDVLERQLELKVEETKRVAEAEANVKVNLALVHEAAITLAKAKLKLDRMTIPAPISGRVLHLVARPGSKLMGLAPAAMQDATTVVTMYDPHSLQVRADVRLEDLPRVLVGQTVRIETAAVGEPMTGKVITATSLADIQKNTLQVKVAIDSPPPVIKPDMLVQVTFLAPPSPKPLDGSESPLRLMIPRGLIDTSSGSSTVWIADQSEGVARRRTVTIGTGTTGATKSNELVEVTSGLSIGDRLIASGRETLTERQRIRIRGEDGSQGEMSKTGIPPHEPHDKPKRLY